VLPDHFRQSNQPPEAPLIYREVLAGLNAEGLAALLEGYKTKVLR
jgi:hypothetical protein